MTRAYAYARACAELVGLFAIAGLLSALAGCGAQADAVARTTLATSARVVDAVDAANGIAMRETRDSDVEAAPSREDALRRRAPYWRVQESVDGTRELLFAAELALDAGAHDAFIPVAQCVVHALHRLREAVLALEQVAGVDIPIPDEIDTALEILRRFGGVCRVPVSERSAP